MLRLKVSLCLLSAVLIAGCSTTSTPVSPEKVLPEQNCLQPAQQLPQLKTGQMEEIVRLIPKIADQYYDLAARHQCLVDFVR